MSPELRRRIAVHEAGHYVAAVHLGFHVTQVDLKPTHCVGTEEALVKHGEEAIVVASAGAAAENLLLGPQKRIAPSGADANTISKAWSEMAHNTAAERPDWEEATRNGGAVAEELMSSHIELVAAVADAFESALQGPGSQQRTHAQVAALVASTESGCADCATRLAGAVGGPNTIA